MQHRHNFSWLTPCVLDRLPLPKVTTLENLKAIVTLVQKRGAIREDSRIIELGSTVVLECICTCVGVDPVYEGTEAWDEQAQ